MPLKVFISGTSRDLKSYRQTVTDWARERGYEPVVQDEFPVNSDYGTIVQMLRDKLAPCDAVIHLAGWFYGFEPTNFPPGERRRSYTQLEFELGKEHRKPVYRFITRNDYTLDNPIDQSAELRELQRQHRERLTRGCEPYSATSRTTGNELYYEFSQHDELRKLLDLIEIKPHVSKPVNLPFRSIGSLFKGREEFLEKLRKTLIEKPTHIAAVTGKQAIHGLGGIGKTRAAIEYGWRHEHEYTALLFVSADSPDRLRQNLAALCGAMVLNLPEQAAQELPVQVAAAVQWLREHAGWFLILDNVDTEEAATEVEKLLGQLATGHVVITSRLSSWSMGVEALDLDVLSASSGAEFLLERTAGRRVATPTDVDEAQLLTRDLDGLALALEQAGAFIARHRVSFASYRQRWQEHDQKVLEWFNEREMNYPRSVATTWQTSIDQLGEDGRSLLNVICWLAPAPIPRTLFEGLASSPLPPGQGPGVRGPDPSASSADAPLIDVETGLADLTTYSLAKWNDESSAVQVHRLVEEITRYRLAEEERRGWFQLALQVVDQEFPFDSDDVRFWPVCEALGPHATAVTRHAERYGNPEPTARLVNQIALYRYGRADYAGAEALMRRALAIDELQYGGEHPDVVRDLSNLVQLLQALNRPMEAEPLMRRALAIGELLYGPEHPNIAIQLNNLAHLLKATNRLAEAEPLIRRSLAIGEQYFKFDPAWVGYPLNNLAMLLMETNRIVEAEPLMRRALAIGEQSYGPEHPCVAIRLNNLALMLQATNRLAEAERLMRRALSINEHSYGTEHPSVAIALSNLSLLLKATNRLAEAEPLMRRALAIAVQFQLQTGYEHASYQGRRRDYELLLKAMNLTPAEIEERLGSLFPGRAPNS